MTYAKMLAVYHLETIMVYSLDSIRTGVILFPEAALGAAVTSDIGATKLQQCAHDADVSQAEPY